MRIFLVKAASVFLLTWGVSFSSLLNALPLSSAHPLINFGDVRVATGGSEHTVMLTNVGDVAGDVTINAVSFGSSDSGFRLAAANQCGAGVTIALNGTCNLVLEYRPNVFNNQATDSVTIQYNNTQSLKIQLQARAIAPSVRTRDQTPQQIIPTALGSANTTSFTIENLGNEDLQLFDIAVSGTGFSMVPEDSTCRSGGTVGRFTIMPGLCTITVRFQPTQVGPAQGQVTIAHSDTSQGNQSVVQLRSTGLGETGPALQFSEPTIVVPDTVVGSFTRFTIQMKNTGATRLVFQQSELTGDAYAYTPIPGDCGAYLEPNTNCFLFVDFKPTTATTSFGAWTVWHNGSPSMSQVILQGTGLPLATQTAIINLSKTAVTFPETLLLQRSEETVNLSNIGNAPLVLSAMRGQGSNRFQIVSTNCAIGTPIAPGGSCALQIGFTPTHNEMYNGGIEFEHNGTPSKSILSLVGMGISGGTNPELTRSMTEYRHKDFDYYFMTSRANEKVMLDSLAFWERTGHAFNVYETGDAGRVGITRYYFAEIARDQQRGTHFYTLLDSDRTVLDALNPENLQVPRLPFNEGIDAYAYPPIVSGIDGYCADGLSPVYRAFKGNEQFPDDPNHRFTPDLAVYKQLVTDGWTAEGVNFCVPRN